MWSLNSIKISNLTSLPIGYQTLALPPWTKPSNCVLAIWLFYLDSFVEVQETNVIYFLRRTVYNVIAGEEKHFKILI